MMIRIAALNDSSSDSDDGYNDANVGGTKLTKEALENAAYSLYHKGLSYERAGSFDNAIQSFEDLLRNDFLIKPVAISDGRQLHQSSILKYSALKNLAKLYSNQSRNKEAIEALLQAFEIDSTDVSVCYRLGVLANKLNKYVLACRAFEKGLELSPDHWPCIDNLITLLYALNNYEACLCYIAKSLARDCGYVKGLVLRKVILREQPCLEKEYAPAFSQCDMDEVIEYTESLQETDELDVLQAATSIRDTIRVHCKPKPVSTVDLHLPELTWAAVGRRLAEIYEYIEEKSPELNHFSPVVMNTKCAAVTDTNNPPTLNIPEIIVDADGMSNDECNERLPSLELDQHADSDHSQCAPSVPGLSSSDDTLTDAADKTAANSCPGPDSSTSQSSQDSQFDSEVAMLVDDIITTVEVENGGTSKITSASIAKVILEDIIATVMDKAIGQVMVDSTEQVTEDVVSGTMLQHDPVVIEVLEELVTKVEKDLVNVKVAGDHMYARATSSDVQVEPEKTKKDRSTSRAENKRRSARVKLPTTKHGIVEKVSDDKVSHVTELKNFIPDVLTTEISSEHAYHSLAMEAQIDTITNPFPSTPSTAPICFEDETSDVKQFLTSLESNGGVVSVMKEWLFLISEKRRFYWSLDLIRAYVDVYVLFRPCYRVPNILSSDYVENDALLALLWMELKLDLITSAENTKSDLGRIFAKEFTYWEMIIGSKIKLPNHCSEFSVRYYYMAARYYIGLGQSANAINTYKSLLEYMDTLDEMNMPVCLNNNLSRIALTKNKIENELMLLERTQALNELNTVYSSSDYAKVITLLKPTFDTDLSRRYTDSRYSQLSLLLDTVEKLEDMDDSIQWLADSLQELVYHADNSRKGNWAQLIVRNLGLLNSRLNIELMQNSTAISRTRIVRSCLTVIHVNVSALESEKEMPVKSVLPWILVSGLTAVHQTPETSGPVDFPGRDFPPSLKVLIAAHKVLAKYGLCTISEGILLQYMLEQFLEKLSNPDGCSRPQMEQHINQCIYCLYGHPNKKIKSKNLNDHAAIPVPMTWDAAQKLFNYYKPKSVPDFDSYKSSTISADLEHLFRKLVSIVPTHAAPDPAVSHTIDSFLVETLSVEEVAKLSPLPCRSLCAEAYYLLADYYFKNKEPLKAIRHYVWDLYYRPDRFDSWAGMALARSSKLESNLGLMEKQSYDGAFQKLAVSTVQSFTRALQLNRDNVKLWIEYACTAYQLHSFASRTMKTKSELSSKSLGTFTELSEEMLAKARHCYIQASLCNSEEFEEQWLYHYMLGKIAEKSEEGPSVYLDHYVKAGKCLDEEGAQYPPKISYMYSPPYLAVEVLEMYYRVHVSILKSVQRTQSKLHYPLYTKVVKEMMKCPFAVAQMPSPQTPVGRKRKAALEAAEKTTVLKAKRIDAELGISALAPKVSTRRQEKLRLDAEIISEVLEDILSKVDTDADHIQSGNSISSSSQSANSVPSCIQQANGITSGSEQANSNSASPSDYHSALLSDVKVLLTDVIAEVVSRSPSVMDDSSQSVSNPQAMPKLSLSCLHTPTPSSTDDSQIQIDSDPMPTPQPEDMETEAMNLTPIATSSSTDLTTSCVSLSLEGTRVTRKHKLDESEVIELGSSADEDENNCIEVISECMSSMLDQVVQGSSAHSIDPLASPSSADVSVIIADCATVLPMSSLTVCHPNSATDVVVVPTLQPFNLSVSSSASPEGVEGTEAPATSCVVLEVQALTTECSIQTSSGDDTGRNSPTPSGPSVTLSESTATSAAAVDSVVATAAQYSNGIVAISAVTTAAVVTATFAATAVTISNDGLSTASSFAQSHGASLVDPPTFTQCSTASTVAANTQISITSCVAADTQTSITSCVAADTQTSTTSSVAADTQTSTTSCIAANAQTSITSCVPADTQTSTTSCVAAADPQTSTTSCVPADTQTSPFSADAHMSSCSSAEESSSTPALETLGRDELIDACIAALRLCVQRYPLHYKSYFRLAKTYLHDSKRKDLDKVQDLLLGNTAKRREDRFVPQGLFQDRKHNNFFNGVWRNPVEEIERAGSFGAHLYKTIYLLLQFLHEKRDYHLLYQLHTQLQRTPEQERKFLRDADRLLLSSKAMEFAIHSLYKTIGADAISSKNADVGSKGEYNYAAALHQAYKWFTYCNKNLICVPNAQVLLIKAYKSYKISADLEFDASIKVVVADAKEFCQQMFSTRSKDKSKPSSSDTKLGSSDTTRLLVTPIASTTSPSTTKSARDAIPATLPPVRGSFHSFACDKAKKVKPLSQSAEGSATTASIIKLSAPVADIPSSSWLNKAKDGTKALASMFTKPKGP